MRRSQLRNAVNCRPVGLRKPPPMNNRVKQMFEMSLGKEKSATVLRELQPPNTDSLNDNVHKDIDDDDGSSLSSFTQSEVHFLNGKPKGPRLMAHYLPEQCREDYVEQWAPNKTPSTQQASKKKVSRNLFSLQGTHHLATDACLDENNDCVVSNTSPRAQGPVSNSAEELEQPEVTRGESQQDFGLLNSDDKLNEKDMGAVPNIVVIVPSAQEAENFFNISNSDSDNMALLPTAEAALKELECHADEMSDTASNGSDRSFVPSNQPSSDSDEDDEQTPHLATHNSIDIKETASNAEEIEENASSTEYIQDADDSEIQAEGEEDTAAPPPGSRKRNKVRVRQPTSAKRRALQTARNCGQSYISPSSGKIIEKKSAAPLSKCRMKCMTKLTPEECSELCVNLWKLGDHNKRSAMIGSLIQIAPKASQRLHPVDSENKKNRQHTFRYHVVVKNANVPVCKGCFLKIFSITPKFVEIVTRKKLLCPMGGMVSSDLRGRESSGLSEARLAEVREHLNSFPRYQSHYARAKCDRSFLPNTLTLKIMFEEYKSKYPTKPVSRFIYEREFHGMGLKIKPLKIDTCQKCDRLDIAIRYAKTEEERKGLQVEQELHHRKAEKAKTQKQLDTQGVNKKNIVLAFDLQQCLPTPHLQSSVVFYKRQLWTYNLTIHDCDNGKSQHCMWHEGEAERGPNEIGSAVYQYLTKLPDEVEEVTMYSDTCGGQNKNNIMNVALQTVLSHKPTLKTINQKFLVPGHTHLDCDTDHSVIERKKKGDIHLPRDWFNLVRGASSKFSVQHMSQDLQLNFKALLKGRQSPLVKRKKDVNGHVFVWKNVCWIQHRQTLPLGTVAFKDTLDQDAPFTLLNLKRYKKQTITLSPELTYNGPRKISQKKKNDLLELLHLIDPDCRRFYKKLKGDSEIQEDIDPDLDLHYSSNEEDESSSDEDW